MLTYLNGNLLCGGCLLWSTIMKLLIYAMKAFIYNMKQNRNYYLNI
jgi:hypothetical protein